MIKLFITILMALFFIYIYLEIAGLLQETIKWLREIAYKIQRKGRDR